MRIAGLGLNCSGATPDLGCPGNPVILPGTTTVNVNPDGSGTITDPTGTTVYMPPPSSSNTTILLIAAVGIVGLMLLTRR